ncbi:MAG: signal peptidase I [Candidatus Latescibacteria bacterium]|nr:signal peptidase I [Candidatus Latescibacterota bacterium]
MKASIAPARKFLGSLLPALALVLLIRTTVVANYYIPSGSMEDTLLVGDHFLANRFVYGAAIDLPGTHINLLRLPGLRDPAPGDIVVFHSPVEDLTLIKRCVAGPGQTVQIVDKKLYIDGAPFTEPTTAKYEDPRRYPATKSRRDNFGPYRVPPDHFFMMGDNRDNSLDSRFIGPVHRRLIRGQAMLIYWSWAPDPGGPAYTGPASIPRVALSYLGRLPGRIRYQRPGNLTL